MSIGLSPQNIASRLKNMKNMRSVLVALRKEHACDVRLIIICLAGTELADQRRLARNMVDHFGRAVRLP